MTTPLFIDSNIARALEQAEAAASRAFCDAGARLYPDKGLRTLSCAGGSAQFYGPSDPLNAVKGVGLSGPVDVSQWDAVEAHFRETNSPVVIDLCPLADGAFIALLMTRAYRIGSFETVMCRRLNPGEAPPTAPIPPGVAIEPVGEEDIEVWERTLHLGFASGGEPVRFAVDIGRVRAQVPNSLMLMATVEGVPAGGASLATHEGVALMSGAAVLPAFRGRGIQQALTAARLRLATERGCTLAKLDVLAGSASYRNAVRAGFQVAYTRPQLIKAW